MPPTVPTLLADRVIRSGWLEPRPCLARNWVTDRWTEAAGRPSSETGEFASDRVNGPARLGHQLAGALRAQGVMVTPIRPL